jgi:hypothetical protein
VPRLPELRLDQRLQLILDVVLDDDTDGRTLPDLAWLGVRSITSPRRTFGSGRAGDFGVGVVGRYAPRRNGDHSLICFACFIE